MQSASNIFWVALQSNQLADTDCVEDDFKDALNAMKEELRKDGWILPQLESNMRNQVNISNMNIETGGHYPMQSTITKLKSGTNIVGELPIRLKVKVSEWKKKKDNILNHCVKEMNKKDKKNVVILYDGDIYFKDVGKDLKRLIKDKTVIEYPSNEENKKTFKILKILLRKMITF